MATTVIALLGPAGSGKSSVASHLAAAYGAKRYSFAEPLKDIAMRTLNFTHAQCWGTQAEKEAIDPRYGFSARWFLQRLGTEGCRAVLGEDVWSDACLRKINRENPGLAVIEDCRFINEAKKVLSVRDWPDSYPNLKFSHVVRLEAPKRDTIADATHASEAEWSSCPYTSCIAPAAYGLEELFSQVDDLARELRLFPVRPELSI